MKNPTIEEVMAFPWEPKITQEPDGGYKCLVRPNLADFVIYGDTKEELEADWRDALKVHLQAYIDTGKCIPMPYVRVQESQDTRGQSQGRVVLDLDELLAS